MNTRRVYAGPVAIGGGAPVTVQTMTNTDTRDVAATLAQIRAMADAGADIDMILGTDVSAAKAAAAAALTGAAAGAAGQTAGPSGFAAGAGEDGGISASAIQEMIREMVAAEDPKKPMSDQKIADTLNGPAYRDRGAGGEGPELFRGTLGVEQHGKIQPAFRGLKAAPQPTAAGELFLCCQYQPFRRTLGYKLLEHRVGGGDGVLYNDRGGA